MKKMKKGAKRGLALALSAAMVLGVSPLMGSKTTEVKAADTNTSLAGFATKNQLLTGDANGNITINFGKNSLGDTQTWYVLGQEPTVSGENSNLMAKTQFEPYTTYNSSGQEKQYDSSWGCDYNVDPTGTVYVSHYGASEIRQRLLKYAQQTQYFTTAEQALMNATKITSVDKKNSAQYTTTDKLYLPELYVIDKPHIAGIQVGSKAYLVQTNGMEWEKPLWTRTPVDTRTVQIDNRSTVVTSGEVDASVAACYPATNIDLSDVLFASAVPGGSGQTYGGLNDLDTTLAKVLRFKKSNMNSVEIQYDEFKKQLEVTQLPYLSMRIVMTGKKTDGTEFYSVVKNATSNSWKGEISDANESIDWKSVKFWAEYQDSNGLVYATDPEKTVNNTKYYNVTDGDGAKWIKNSDQTLTFTTNGAERNFTSLSVDGQTVDAANYSTDDTARVAGTTNITLNADYLQTLSEEEHTITFNYDDGFPATTTFTVEKDNSSTGGNENPGTNTGDNTWTKDSDTDLVVKPDQKIPTVEEVKVDDKTLEKDKDYTVDKDGNVTINKDYMDKLEEGDHKVDIIGKDTDGKDASTSTTITVKPAADNSGNNGNNGNTGTNGNGTGATGNTSGATTGNTSGADNTWTKDSNTDLVVRPDKKLSEVTEVKINGSVVPKESYTVNADGSVTIKKEYLKTLGEGNYSIEISGKDADGNAVTVAANVRIANTAATSAPKTGETTNPFFLLAGFLGAAAVLAFFFTKEDVEDDRKRLQS